MDKMDKKSAITPKLSGLVLFLIVIFGLISPSAAQEYTKADSAIFQKLLTKSTSAAEQLDLQLKLAEYFIRKPGSFKSDLDNATLLINRSKELNKRVKSIDAQGYIRLDEFWLLQENGASPKNKPVLEEAIRLLNNGKNKVLLGRAYRELAYFYSNANEEDVRTKIKLTLQSIVFFKQGGDILRAAGSLQYLADLYLIVHNFRDALPAINESLSLYKAVNYPQTQGAFVILGTIYFLQDDFDNGIKYLLQALQTAEKLKDSSMQTCEIENLLGVAMVKIAQFDRAVPYYRSALTIARQNNDRNSVILIAENLAFCYDGISREKDAIKVLDDVVNSYKASELSDEDNVRIKSFYLLTLINLKQFGSARNYVSQLLNLADLPHSAQTYNDIYSSVAKYYFAIKDYKRESVFLKKNQEVLEKSNVASVQLYNLTAYYKMDSARNDYRSAFLHLMKYKRLADSIYNDKKSRRIALLLVQYESEKKENEIKIKNQNIKLLTQNAKIDQIQLRSAQLYRNVTFAGIIVILLFAAMQYRRYLEKQKANQLITEQNAMLQNLLNEKEWLVKEVHHRVKNNLHTIICLLESQATYLEEDALKAIENSKHRIYAMSLVHQKLYKSEDIKMVNIKDYLSEFVAYLKESYGSPEKIAVILVAEDVTLGAGQAIPISLIINEAVSNSFKYAFPDQSTGEIRIELKKTDAEEIYLSVSDNGVGFEPQIDQEAKSLGLELIKGLSSDLRGAVEFNSKNGTRIVLRFKIDRIALAADEQNLKI